MKCPELFESRAEVDVTEPRLPRARVGLRTPQKGKKENLRLQLVWQESFAFRYLS